MSQDNSILNSVQEKIKIAAYAKQFDGEISRQDRIELHNMRDQFQNKVNEMQESIKALDRFLDHGYENAEQEEFGEAFRKYTEANNAPSYF